MDDDASVLAEEDDGVGCPLPSTPEDEHLLDCEVRLWINQCKICIYKEKNSYIKKEICAPSQRSNLAPQ